MGYSQLPSNEADASYPPLYEETSSSASGWRNYIHLAKSGELVQRLYLDTDAAPTFGRFKNEEEQKEAKNAFLGGNFVNVTLHIRGSQKAHVVLKGSDQVYRKVIEIVQESGLQPTPFDLSTEDEGKNAIFVVPDDYVGSLTGNIALSEHLRSRAEVLVEDDLDANHTRYALRPGSGRVVKADPEEGSWSSVTNLKVKTGGCLGGKLQITTASEYHAGVEEEIEQEYAHFQAMQGKGWLRRLEDYRQRMHKFAKTGDIVAFYIFMAFLVSVPILIVVLITLASLGIIH